jgi:hypothetical protein
MQSLNALPNFFIIGAAKSGTTTLYSLLDQHPQVYFPFAKEPKYFNNDANYARGTEWYIHRYFKQCAQFPARGEATPHYLFWGRKVAPRIQATCRNENPKFIAIFRDPVKRAYSQYWMDVQREFETLPFAEALAHEEERLQAFGNELAPAGLLKYAYFRGGCYASLLQPFLEHFPRANFHFLLQEDLQSDLIGSMRRLSDFLGIQADFPFREVISNPAQEPRSRRMHRYLLHPSGVFYRVVRGILRILPDASRHLLRQRVMQSNLRPAEYPPMDPQVERRLRARFREEIVKLEDILQRDLKTWYQEAE